MIFRGKLFSIVVMLLLLQPPCKLYSFKGTNFDPALKSYYVGQFKISAFNAPATINQTFSEALKEKIARESKLKYTDLNPDLEFNGTIQTFQVDEKAPLPGETVSFNRLTISVSVEYTNHLNPKDKWTKNFSHFEDFLPSENLLNVQDQLIEVIFRQILEDIFNQAFNNW